MSNKIIKNAVSAYKKEIKLSKDIEMVYKGISFLPNRLLE